MIEQLDLLDKSIKLWKQYSTGGKPFDYKKHECPLCHDQETNNNCTLLTGARCIVHEITGLPQCFRTAYAEVAMGDLSPNYMLSDLHNIRREAICKYYRMKRR